jgi:hypothetical protein
VENASKWINMAYGMLPPNDRSLLAAQITLYKKELDVRAQNIPKLDRQLGIENPVEAEPSE